MSLAIAEIHVEGMSCQGCVASITRALQTVPGVAEASVSLSEQRATVRYDDAQITAAVLVQTIEDAGFDARPAAS